MLSVECLDALWTAAGVWLQTFQWNRKEKQMGLCHESIWKDPYTECMFSSVSFHVLLSCWLALPGTHLWPGPADVERADLACWEVQPYSATCTMMAALEGSHLGVPQHGNWLHFWLCCLSLKCAGSWEAKQMMSEISAGASHNLSHDCGLPPAQPWCSGAGRLCAAWWCWLHAMQGLLAAADPSSLLPKKLQTPNRVIFTASFIWEIRISSACCYGNTRVKENDLIMIYDEIPFGVGSLPQYACCGGNRAGGCLALVWGSWNLASFVPSSVICLLLGLFPLAQQVRNSSCCWNSLSPWKLAQKLWCVTFTPGSACLWEGHCNRNGVPSVSWTNSLDVVTGIAGPWYPLCMHFLQITAAALEPQQSLELCLLSALCPIQMLLRCSAGLALIGGKK